MRLHTSYRFQCVYCLYCCRYGRRIVYLLSAVAFLGATFGCIFAPNVSVLVAFRALQGAGGKHCLFVCLSFGAANNTAALLNG
jgi:MFS family permease